MFECLIRYPDDEAGEIPMACVVRKPGSSFKEDELISFTEKKVSRVMFPFVFFLILYSHFLKYCVIELS